MRQFFQRTTSVSPLSPMVGPLHFQDLDQADVVLTIEVFRNSVSEDRQGPVSEIRSRTTDRTGVAALEIGRPRHAIPDAVTMLASLLIAAPRQKIREGYPKRFSAQDARHLEWLPS